MKKDYKVVVVLGNGFDLDLKLKTKYADFLGSSFFKDHVDKNRIDERIDYSFSKEINIFNYLSNQSELNNWIDIETELANLATRKADYNKGYGKGVYKKASKEEERTFVALHDALCDYLKTIDYGNVNHDATALALLRIIAQHREIEILSFNYTDLHKLEPLIGRFNNEIDYIHGRISDNSIILGFEDDIDIDDSYCFMIKSFNPYFKSHNVRQKLLEADEIIFFGHSLGNTDYHYFKDLFLYQSQADKANPKLKLRIFTFNENSRRDILVQLRVMNEKRINMLYNLCDFGVFRTGVSQDEGRIKDYLADLEKRLGVEYAIKYIP